MRKLTEKSRVVLGYVQEHDGENFVAADIAEALGLEKRSVEGVLTSLGRTNEEKGITPLTQRVEAEVELTDEEGKAFHKVVKFIKLTDEGRAYDLNAPVED